MSLTVCVRACAVSNVNGRTPSLESADAAAPATSHHAWRRNTTGTRCNYQCVLTRHGAAASTTPEHVCHCPARVVSALGRPLVLVSHAASAETQPSQPPTSSTTPHHHPTRSVPASPPDPLYLILRRRPSTAPTHLSSFPAPQLAPRRLVRRPWSQNTARRARG